MKSISNSLHKFFSIFLLLLLSLIGGGCSTKECGIDKEIFQTFSPTKQEAICEKYLQQRTLLRQLAEKRRLIEAKNRQKELEIEKLRLQILYKNLQTYPANLLELEVYGFIGRKKRTYRIYPRFVDIVRGEAKRVCLKSEKIGGCFWMAYIGNRILIHPRIPRRCKLLGRCVLPESENLQGSNTLSIPLDELDFTPVSFMHNGKYYSLRIKRSRFRRNCNK
ncbi:hypothetical protein [Nitratiruptor tergarcus]|uniref:Lipoprotein n=1 Tax=Nitratiruptor tergarcus DSM 16512 TaxID=1069081 RepID=A0A1W1WQM3_9BACT|nr:hypothetical protein [Nitratiruptor tergarcus]SMC08495.1 hypothetical protein SAMN05660197_0247 [Nitratiruptor tergarcus DSM 16512]